MRAAFIERYGKNVPISVDSQPDPQPGAGEALVTVHAASVNPIDFKLPTGAISALLPYRMPLILGNDMAGVIRALGPGLDGFAIGDRVAARLNKKRIGAFAEAAIVPKAQLARIPAGVDFEHASAVALAGLTAWQCLTEVLRVKSGQRVLIHAGSGGVGHLAIQLARDLGAQVTTTASAANHAWLKRLGAQQCVDYRTEEFERVCAPFDAVLDTQGGAILRRSIRHTKRGGRVVSIGDLPTPAVAFEFGKPWLAPVFLMLSAAPKSLALTRGVAYRYWFMREDGAQLQMLLDKLASGKLEVEITQRYTLDQTTEALAQSAAGKVRGKAVILPQ